MIYKRGTGDAILRLIAFAILSNTGRIITGTIFIIIGLFYGFKSHMVVYHYRDLHAYTIFTSTRSTRYSFQDQYSQNIYQAELTEFTSYFSTTDLQDATLSLVYSDIDSSTANGGNDHHILRLAITDQNGNQLKAFETFQYQQHPKSYFENDWSDAGIMLGIGGAFWLVTLLLWWSIPKVIAWQEKHHPKEFSEVQIAHFYNQQTRNPWSSSRRSNPPPDFRDLAR
ncbi:hypothetical protein KDA_09540 [Dictyobacter alpinus]|uniref:Uncharacterized protein n=1 Tax=Dictyobacter alpinus TaxID=2014873 RepID=A0A402B284_9CHLR|nr:hypothetical protein [Dictyobacter alpinus]GCE25470.1 hypothetical protein KDA_09540 [Dictyobacter alpinus]